MNELTAIANLVDSFTDAETTRTFIKLMANLGVLYEQHAKARQNGTTPDVYAVHGRTLDAVCEAYQLLNQKQANPTRPQ